MTRPGARLLAVAVLAATAGGCGVAASLAVDLSAQRAAMVREIRQTAAEYPGLAAEPWFAGAIAAVGAVRREDFVRPADRQHAYEKRALPIGYDQTISDPYIVTVMTAAVHARAGSNVLEIGTGSGYQAAVLSQLGATVHSVEIIAPLAKSAAARLARLRVPNVAVRAGDGFLGWADHAPYDAIIVTAGAAAVPKPLTDQLKPGGRLIMPVGPEGPLEQLVVMTKQADGALNRCSMGPSMFVPLTGRGERPDTMRGLYDRSIPLCYPGQRTVFSQP